MRLRIPDEHRGLFKAWLALDDSEAERFASAVEGAAPQLLLGDFAKEVTKACPSLEESTANDFVTMFVTIALSSANAPKDKQAQFLDEVFRDIAGDVPELIGAWEGKKARIRRMVDAAGLQITGKALYVMGEQERPFCSARILTDMRPVFADPDIAPKAVVVVHQLKLTVHARASGGTDAIFVAMDRDDLIMLRDVLERALAKHEALRVFTVGAGLPLLEGGNK